MRAEKGATKQLRSNIVELLVVQVGAATLQYLLASTYASFILVLHTNQTPRVDAS